MGFEVELDCRNEQQRRMFLGCFDRWLERKLDDVLDEQGVETVDLLKLDVEGSEPAVLRGAMRSLRRTRHVICEINGPYLARQGLSPLGLIRQLTDVGFRLLGVSGNAP